jgi:hypothetical protein
MLKMVKLSKDFWVKAITMVCFLQNWSFTFALTKTTFEFMYGSNSNPIFLIFKYFGVSISPTYLIEKKRLNFKYE